VEFVVAFAERGVSGRGRAIWHPDIDTCQGQQGVLEAVLRENEHGSIRTQISIEECLAQLLGGLQGLFITHVDPVTQFPIVQYTTLCEEGFFRALLAPVDKALSDRVRVRRQGLLGLQIDTLAIALDHLDAVDAKLHGSVLNRIHGRLENSGELIKRL
jgi:hypothetical protein